jgi:hypothetical protein
VFHKVVVQCPLSLPSLYFWSSYLINGPRQSVKLIFPVGHESFVMYYKIEFHSSSKMNRSKGSIKFSSRDFRGIADIKYIILHQVSRSYASYKEHSYNLRKGLI